MANPHADLGALSVRRDATPLIRPPRRWVGRVVAPGVLLAGFAGLAAWSAWDLVAPPRAVTVVPVVVRSGGPEEPAGQELFRATGWIEPRPLPVDVPVQTEGAYRVKEVRVNPGDRVRAGQVLVLLDDESARLDVEAAQKRLAKRRASAESARAGITRAEVAARTAAEGVGLAKEEGDAEVKAQQADVAKAEALLAAAALTLKAEEDLRATTSLSSDLKVQQVRQQRDVAAAELASAKAKLGKAATAADVRVKQAEAARAAADADVAAARAKLGEAEEDAADAAVDVKRVELELARTRIAAPIDGAVMQLHVRTGTVLGGNRIGGPEGHVVATLYDPKKLQVRVEVPVTKFQHVRLGHPALVEVEDVLPGVELTGTVLYDTRQANVARNSVPVKVALPDNPPEQLRPEMIATVRFQAPAAKGTPKTDAVRRLVVPRRLLAADGDAVRVWVVDPVAGRAELRPVELARGERDHTGELVEVVGGLQPTDKLIATGREGLTPGMRVRVVGEER